MVARAPHRAREAASLPVSSATRAAGGPGRLPRAPWSGTFFCLLKHSRVIPSAVQWVVPGPPMQEVI